MKSINICGYQIIRKYIAYQIDWAYFGWIMPGLNFILLKYAGYVGIRCCQSEVID